MNYSGKHICLFLSTTTKVVEACIHNGKIEIDQYFTVDTSMFYNAQGINNIDKMVKVICAQLHYHNVSSKRILILSDSLGIDTKIFKLPPTSEPWYKQDVGEMFGRKKHATDPNKLQQEVKLGKCLIDGDFENMMESASVDRELSISLYSAFAQNGFKLVSLESTDTACLNFRALLESSYDENGKVIINIDKDKATAYWCFGDIPIDIKTWVLSSDEDMVYQLDNYLSRDIAILQIRQPQIALISTIPIDYVQICKELRANGFSVFDFSDLLRTDEFFTYEYILPLSLLLKVYFKNGINLTCTKKHPTDAVKLKRGKYLCAVSFVLLSLSIFCAGANGLEYLKKIDTIKQSPNELMLQAKEAELRELQYKTQLFGTVNSKLTDLVTFTGGASGIYIASIDTWDMLPKVVVKSDDPTVAGELLDAPTDSMADTITGAPADTEPEALPIAKKSIVVRGYSLDANLVVSFFNSMKLQNGYSDYILTGVEKIPELDVYAFEIEVKE